MMSWPALAMTPTGFVSVVPEALTPTKANMNPRRRARNETPGLRPNWGARMDQGSVSKLHERIGDAEEAQTNLGVTEDHSQDHGDRGSDHPSSSSDHLGGRSGVVRTLGDDVGDVRDVLALLEENLSSGLVDELPDDSVEKS
jgi:hypothetical protein